MMTTKHTRVRGGGSVVLGMDDAADDDAIVRTVFNQIVGKGGFRVKARARKPKKQKELLAEDWGGIDWSGDNRAV